MQILDIYYLKRIFLQLELLGEQLKKKKIERHTEFRRHFRITHNTPYPSRILQQHCFRFLTILFFLYYLEEIENNSYAKFLAISNVYYVKVADFRPLAGGFIPRAFLTEKEVSRVRS